MITSPEIFPALSYGDAASRIQAMIADENETQIHPLSHTRFWTHGDKTPHAILLLHGYTDSTNQFAGLGTQLFGRGYNVFAPRLTYHGYRDRLSTDHGRLTADELIDWANDAVDAALGLGDELTVMGLSLGGVLAAWVAEFRTVDASLIIAPAFGTRALPSALTPLVGRIVYRLPNLFLWWDPRVREHTGNDYAYPRFATHTIAQLFILGGELLKRAKSNPPAAKRVWMVTNENDFAVSNILADKFVTAWLDHPGVQVNTYQFPRSLGLAHDLVDETEHGAKPAVVYPQLIQLVEQASS